MGACLVAASRSLTAILEGARDRILRSADFQSLYRRVALGRACEVLELTVCCRALCGLQIRDTAGWNPALRAEEFCHATFSKEM